MRRITLLIGLIACPFLSYGQFANNTTSKDTFNIYYQALSHYLDFIKKKDNVTIDTLFIEDEYEINTDSLLTQIGTTKLVILNTQALINELKSKKDIELYRIFSLGYKNNEFYVSFVPFSVTKRKKRFYFTNPGGYFVFFHFDNGLFKFIRVEDHGI